MRQFTSQAVRERLAGFHKRQKEREASREPWRAYMRAYMAGSLTPARRYSHTDPMASTRSTGKTTAAKAAEAAAAKPAARKTSPNRRSSSAK